jgi:hypothetical protein
MDTVNRPLPVTCEHYLSGPTFVPYQLYGKDDGRTTVSGPVHSGVVHLRDPYDGLARQTWSMADLLGPMTDFSVPDLYYNKQLVAYAASAHSNDAVGEGTRKVSATERNRQCLRAPFTHLFPPVVCAAHQFLRVPLAFKVQSSSRVTCTQQKMQQMSSNQRRRLPGGPHQRWFPSQNATRLPRARWKPHSNRWHPCYYTAAGPLIM